MITIVDYGDTNAVDVGNCLKQLTDDIIISNNEIDICRADKIIFPGSGIASSAMKKIHMLNLFSVLRIIQRPILGIGLGMQLMVDYSLEGNVSCLGIFPGTSIKFDNDNSHHSNEGMSSVMIKRNSSLFDNIEDDQQFYFNHAYYIPKSDLTTSTSKNNVEFSASIERNHSFGVQFHPEKSGEAGKQLLKNFLKI